MVCRTSCLPTARELTSTNARFVRNLSPRLLAGLVAIAIVAMCTSLFAETEPQVSLYSAQNAAELPVAIDPHDLLANRVPLSNLNYQAGTAGMLTDGQGVAGKTEYRVFAVDDTSDWVFTFSNLRIATLNEIRVFAWNVDQRAYFDFDVHGSADDGVSWQPLAKNVAQAKYGRLNLACIKSPDSSPLTTRLTDLRFTFRNCNDRGNPRDKQHTSLFEIDALGVAEGPLTIESVLAELDEPINFKRHIAPIFESYCVHCHDAETNKGNMQIAALDPNMVEGNDTHRWRAMLDALNRGEMPPPDMDRPNDKERLMLIHWLASELDKAAAAGRGQTPVVPRRLNRTQYGNTLRDLLGIDLPFEDELPDDGLSPEGFKNNGATLNTSSLHVEYYMQLARQALSKAIHTKTRPLVHHFRVELGRDINPNINPKNERPQLGFAAHILKPEDYRYSEPQLTKPFPFLQYQRRTKYTFHEGYQGNATVKGDRDFDEIFHSVFVGLRHSNKHYTLHEDGVELKPAIYRGKTRYGTLKLVIREYPQAGRFVVRVRASVPPESIGPEPQLVAYIGVRRDDGQGLSVIGKPQTVERGAARVYEFSERLENMVMPVYETDNRNYLGNLMHIGVWNQPTEQRAETTLKIHAIDFEGPWYQEWPTATHRKIFIDSPHRGDKPRYAREILAGFLARAWRRPPTSSELDRMHRYWREIYQEATSFENSILDTLAIALASPQFLYITEPVSAGRMSDKVDQFQLATRLSYFLWNSMPDEQLTRAASTGELRPKLKKHLARMIQDSKFDDFVSEFVDQWLDVSRLDRVVVERRRELTPELRSSMKQETYRFIGELLHRDGRVADLIDSDFAMLNAGLAKLYRIDGVEGDEFRRVTLQPDNHRGGLLTHASMLLGHSSGRDSHPVKRGVWLTKKLLNAAPPPPPPGVPPLDEENPKLRNLPVRKQLEIHRDNEACYDCHRKIDPWGVALEQYDAIGLYRGNKRDASTDLPDGTHINGVASLKTHLLQRRLDDISECFVRHLMSYALGRSLSLADRPAVKQIVDSVRKHDYRLLAAIEAIVLSPQFQESTSSPSP